MQLTLLLQNIKDELTRENFYRLLQWFEVQPLLQSDFKFFEVDIPKANAVLKFSHGLSFTPKDIILLGAVGDQRFYFRYQEFDSKNIYLTNSGPVRIRFLVGLFNTPGLGKGSVDYPFVAP